MSSEMNALVRKLVRETVLDVSEFEVDQGAPARVQVSDAADEMRIALGYVVREAIHAVLAEMAPAAARLLPAEAIDRAMEQAAKDAAEMVVGRIHLRVEQIRMEEPTRYDLATSKLRGSLS